MTPFPLVSTPWYLGILYLQLFSYCCFRSEFISVSVNSAIATHSQGRRYNKPKEETTEHILKSSNLFLITEHKLLTQVQEYPVLSLGSCCEKTWSTLEEYSLDYIRITSETDKSFWHKVREFRITGSRCYKLYTFNQRPKSDEEWRAASY